MAKVHRSSSAHCYCAFCRSPRTVYRKRHLSVTDAFFAFVAATLLSFVIWQDIDPRALLFFVIAVGLTEAFILLQWRLAIACRHCGFDPVLYKRKPDEAALRVKTFLDVRRTDPLYLMSATPRLPVVARGAPVRGAAKTSLSLVKGPQKSAR